MNRSTHAPSESRLPTPSESRIPTPSGSCLLTSGRSRLLTSSGSCLLTSGRSRLLTSSGSRPLTSRLAVLVIMAALLFLASGRSWAQPKEENKAAAKDPDAPKVQVERGKGGKKVYVIKTGFVIEGRIQKPNAFYVLQRSQINYDWAALKQRFVPRILDAVKKSPF